MKYLAPAFAAFALFLLSSCFGGEELSSADLDALPTGGLDELLAKTVSKPWQGEPFRPGPVAGTWHDVMSEDPKSFNILAAEQDSATAAVVESMLDWLLDYDMVRRAWKPEAASYEIRTDEDAGTLDVIYTLREGLFWSYYNSPVKIPVSSDDVVFWYNEIEGDPVFNSSGYNSQFLRMEDGSEARITIEKLDHRRFVFHFPRIVADPLLSTNRTLAPRLDYEAAKHAGGPAAVLALFGVDSDPQKIPSVGKWFLTEYTPGQRLVYRRNPAYWNQDEKGTSIPYVQERIIRIIPDQNTQFLLFKEGETDAYRPRPEDLDELVNKPAPDYTVFNAEGSLGAAFWTFNQNPKNRATPQYRWFTHTTFRQAMSCLLNRDRIARQVYRSLAEPKLNFFPEPNPYYNPGITLQYRYDPERALELLASIGMIRDEEGVLRDDTGEAVRFDLSIQSENALVADTASIIMAELAQVGITVQVRVVDFQKMVEQLFTSFDWQSALMGLSGSNIFPTQGSNVWPSDGNLHLWYPRQEKPATDWEARIDYLYNEGAYTLDREKAQAYWDEYQRILLDQCPVIFLLRSRSFFALRNRWDQSNVYFDNLNGAETTHIFLTP